jgi:hypothetical protein
MGFRGDKHLIIDKPTGHNYMSSETCPIKVTNLDSEKIRANEIAIENSKTGKVTAVVAVMYLSKDKICNSRSAKQKPLAKDRQKSASKAKNRSVWREFAKM